MSYVCKGYVIYLFSLILSIFITFNKLKRQNDTGDDTIVVKYRITLKLHFLLSCHIVEKAKSYSCFSWFQQSLSLSTNLNVKVILVYLYNRREMSNYSESNCIFVSDSSIPVFLLHEFMNGSMTISLDDLKPYVLYKKYE